MLLKQQATGWDRVAFNLEQEFGHWIKIMLEFVYKRKGMHGGAYLKTERRVIVQSN